MKTNVTFNIDTDRLDTYTDEYIAALWHIAQLNPAPHGDHDAGVVVEHIGRENVMRWLRGVPVPVWYFQGRDYYHQQLIRFARWNGMEWVPDTAPSEQGAV